MRLINYILSGFIFITVQSCSENKEKHIPKTQVQAPEKPWKVVPVKANRPEFTIILPGELLPYEQVSIYPKIKGFIKKIYVDRGSYVYKGQVLARLEAPEIGEQFAARQSSANTAYQKYIFSKQAYYRLKEASKKSGAVATIELERAYARFLGDSAAYQSSRYDAAATGQMNKYLAITAPFSGVITGRFISEGALVGDLGAKSEPLFQLSQQNKLRLTVAIPEKQVQALPLGTQAAFTVVDLPGKTFSATLSRNSGALDASSRSVIAEFDVPNPVGNLRAGQYAKVTLRLKRQAPSLWVPESSVVETQSGVFVVKIENNAAKRIPVQTGINLNSLKEVFGNLQPGDSVLFKGSEEIKEGTAFLKNHPEE